MHLNLNNYQLKTSRYNYTPTYMNHMVTTNQKPVTDMQKLSIYRKEHKHSTKENHQTSSTTNAKGTSLNGNAREEKDLQKQNQNN